VSAYEDSDNEKTDSVHPVLGVAVAPESFKAGRVIGKLPELHEINSGSEELARFGSFRLTGGKH